MAQLDPDRVVHCAVCDARTAGETVSVSEKMYGTGETFHYLQCAECGCLVLCDRPADMGPYYPRDYYSQTPAVQAAVTTWLKRRRAAATLGRAGPLGSLLRGLTGEPPVLRWLRPLTGNRQARILDIGSGSGKILSELNIAGFTNLVGVDPYVDRDSTLEGGVRILKCELHELQGEFDVVMMHHVLEHMDDPVRALEVVRSLLAPAGGVVIRTPVVGNHAWRVYREHWIQLDPPRHLIIHSARSLQILAARTGFLVDLVEYDSGAFQFWGSEQDRAGIPLRSPDSYGTSRRRSMFRRSEIKKFEQRAAALNRAGDGDQLCLYLRRT